MKRLLAITLFTSIPATSAMAGVQFETRAFHANLRLDAGRATSVSLGSERVEDFDISKDYLNTAGVGVALVAPVTSTIDLGLGASLARYNPTPGAEINQEVIQGFSRVALAQNEFVKFYLLAGVSRHQLKQHIDGNEYERTRARYTPVVNSDLGLGLIFPIARGDLGFEYKHSNTIAQGRGTIKSTYSIPRIASGAEKIKIRDLDLEGQELSLTFGIRL